MGSRKFLDPIRVVSVTTTQRDALSGIADGDAIYNSTLNALQIRQNGGWATLLDGVDGGALSLASIPYAGSAIPTSLLHNFRDSAASLRQILVIGDSIVQGSVNGIEGFVSYLRKDYSDQTGQNANAGFYGVWRSVNAVTNGTDWTFAGTWTEVTKGSTSDLGPFSANNDLVQAAASTSNIATLTIPANVVVTEFDVIYVDSTGGGTSGFSYSINGGGSWVNVTTSRPGTPTLTRTTITGVSLGSGGTIKIRAANAAGTTSAIAGLLGIDLRASASGVSVHNVGRDGVSLVTGIITSTRPTGWDKLFGLIDPDLVVVLISNDAADATYDGTAFPAALATFITTVKSYGAEILFLGSFAQDPVNGASSVAITKTNGSAVIGSAALFTAAMVGWPITGTGIPASTTVLSYQNTSQITMSANATDGASVTATIGGRHYQAQVRAAIQAAAATGGCGYIDLSVPWGTLQASRNDGLINADGVHPNSAGARDIATRIARFAHLWNEGAFIDRLSIAPNVQEFSAGVGTYTWTKPARAQMVLAEVIAPGGGGGGGPRGAAGTLRKGGGGGAGGATARHWFIASDMGSTETITIGAAGTGGAGSTVNSTNGTDGTLGGDVTIGSLLTVKGGGPGFGNGVGILIGWGSTAGSSEGISGYGGTSIGALLFGSTTPTASGGVGTVGGGGAGGDITAGDVVGNGNGGGMGTAGVGGTGGAGAGGAATSGTKMRGGGGGAGGAARKDGGGAAYAGSAGGAKGGGGGGGGASLNGQNGGAGGNGGIAYVRVTTICA